LFFSTHLDLYKADLSRKLTPMNKASRCCIAVRCSTNRQDTERQVHELRKVAESRNLEVVEVITETISGKTNGSDRHDLKRIIELADAGEIGHVLTSEVSRLARKNSVAHKFLEDLTDLGCNLYWHSHQMDTLLKSGKKSPVASMLFAFMADQARAETELLGDRIRSGLALARKRGVRLGRPEGKVPTEEFLRKHKDIRKKLREGFSVRNTAKLTGKSTFTVQKVKRALASA